MSYNDAQLAQLKELVGQVLPADQAAVLVEYARIDAFTNDDGEIDQDKVMGHLTAIFAAGKPEQLQPAQWGQFSGHVPAPAPGAAGRAEAARRHGKPQPDETAIAAARFTGNTGRAEAQRRSQRGKR